MSKVTIETSVAEKEIAECFAHIVGQKRTLAGRIMAHTAFALGSDEPCNVFYGGAAGLGKTHLLKAEAQARQVAWQARFGFESKVTLFKTAGEWRTDRDSFSKFRASLQNDAGTVADEFHELGQEAQGKETTKCLKSLLVNDRTSPLRSHKFDDSGEIHRMACEIFVGVGTNFPSEIRDHAAVVSRFGGVKELELYNASESREILALILKEKGVRISDGSLDLIADTARGTARPLEMLVSTLAQIATVKRKPTVNRDDCFEAMIAKDIYPLGLSRREIRILQLCKMRQDKAGLATEFRVNVKELAEDFGTLRQAGFVTTKGSFLSTSVLGAAYLQQAREKGFKF